MVVSGVTHVTSPGYYRGLVPSWLPAHVVVGLGCTARAAPVARRATGRPRTG